MGNLYTTLLISSVLLILLPSGAYAFGAGEIPDFAYLNDKAFRHGDIEGVLSELAKTAGHAAAGGGLLTLAKSVLSSATGGSKFSSQDVKRVYFGNWLRDYSQAMDIAGLSKLTSETLVLIVSVLGFLTFGFATEEYEVTAERLGVYLPVEHIDNPKGYAENEGDARQFHPKLRPPVNPEELEIDRRTGMKKYMATEGRGWDTSTAHIRRTFRACIEHGRRARGREDADLWEAYRLLGTGLHTMEDLLAHSNWCELALRKMGYEQVFCFVGENVMVNTPNGEAPPLITGTFGSADFLHSLMGEATDHLSQASVVDLSKRLQDASQNEGDTSIIRSILEKLSLGGGGGDADAKMSQADVMKQKSQAYHFDPNNVASPEVQQQLWELLQWRDGIFREVVGMIEMIPGLSDLIDSLTNALNAYVYTILAPYLTPIVQQVTDVLGESSKAVINSEDQYEVFDNPDASDPSHSLLSKDHFSLILNEPAGKIAQIVVRYSVKLIVDAWSDESINPDRVIDQILEAFHHPYFNVGRSRIQREMYEEMEKWLGGLGPEEAERIIECLTKESVREGRNKREGADDDIAQSDQVYNGLRQNRPGQGPAYGGAAGGHNASQGEYAPQRRQDQGSSEDQYGSSYQSRPSYGGSENRFGVSGGRYGEDNTYGRSNEADGNRYNEQASERTYGRSDNEYTGRHTRSSNEAYEPTSESYRRSDENDSSGEAGRPYGGSGYRQNEDDSYGRQNLRRDGDNSGYRPSYQPSSEPPPSSRRYDDQSNNEYSSYRREREESRQEDEYGGADRYSAQGRYRGSERTYGGDEYQPPSGFTRQSEDTGYGRSASGDYGGYSEHSGASRDEYSGDTRDEMYGKSSQEDDYGRDSRNNAYSRDNVESGRREERSYGRNEDEYGESNRRTYGGGDEYSSRGEHNRESGGYGERYGESERQRSYGGDEETFGAERLQINDEYEDRPRHHGGHGHHNRREEEEY